MNKSRVFLSSLAILLLIGISLWFWPRSERAAGSSVSVVQTPPAAGGQKSSAAAVDDALSTTPGPVTPPRQAARAGRSDSLAVGTLLADPSLDDQAVMSGLSKMTLDASLPIGERTDAMGHLLNLSVEDPSAVLLPLIGEARLPDSLCQQILDDSLNDSPSWQADASLAALAHRSGREIKHMAREHLAFLTGADHGDNIAEWSQAVASSREKWARLQP